MKYTKPTYKNYYMLRCEIEMNEECKTIEEEKCEEQVEMECNTVDKNACTIIKEEVRHILGGNNSLII